jgi:hypothetical protein
LVPDVDALDFHLRRLVRRHSSDGSIHQSGYALKGWLQSGRLSSRIQQKCVKAEFFGKEWLPYIARKIH